MATASTNDIPLDVLRKYSSSKPTIQEQLRADTIALVLAAREVLAHVEDEKAERVGMQCTLCHTYRAMLRKALIPFGCGE